MSWTRHSRRVYNALFPFINSEIATTPAGRMSEAEKTQWAGRAINSPTKATAGRRDHVRKRDRPGQGSRHPGNRYRAGHGAYHTARQGRGDRRYGNVLRLRGSSRGRGGGSLMALNGTPWHFERLAVNVDGIGEVISVTSRWTGTLRSVASRPPIVKATRAVQSAVFTRARRRSNWRLRRRSTS